MLAYSKRGLENGGGVTQSEVRGDRELGYGRKMPVGWGVEKERRWWIGGTDEFS